MTKYAEMLVAKCEARKGKLSGQWESSLYLGKHTVISDNLVNVLTVDAEGVAQEWNRKRFLRDFQKCVSDAVDKARSDFDCKTTIP